MAPFIYDVTFCRLTDFSRIMP